FGEKKIVAPDRGHVLISDLGLFAIRTLTQAHARPQLDRAFDVAWRTPQVRLNDRANIAMLGIDALENVERPLRHDRAFHVDAHERIAEVGGALDDSRKMFDAA